MKAASESFSKSSASAGGLKVDRSLAKKMSTTGTLSAPPISKARPLTEGLGLGGWLNPASTRKYHLFRHVCFNSKF